MDINDSGFLSDYENKKDNTTAAFYITKPAFKTGNDSIIVYFTFNYFNKSVRGKDKRAVQVAG